jgi:hypothetical protein
MRLDEIGLSAAADREAACEDNPIAGMCVPVFD